MPSRTEVPGQVERLGGRAVHWVHQTGRSPAVILLGGCGVPYYMWDDAVQLLPDVDVSRLDRPGLVGTTWPGVLPRLAAEVDTLVELVGRVGGPAVVVAHSMAGLHAEALARSHPELMSALVLVDSSVEWDAKPPRGEAGWLRLARAVRRLMALRPLTPIGSLAEQLLVAVQSHRRLRDASSPTARAVFRERDALASVVAEQAAYGRQIWDLDELRKSQPMPPIGVVVLTAAGDGGKGWVKAQARLAALLAGEHRVVDASRHLMMIDRPDVVAEAVRDVLSGLLRRDV